MTAAVDVVVVNWNTRDLVLAALASVPGALRDGRAVRTVVVDNGSEDGSVAAIQAAFPGVEVIANTRNVGFAIANNQAIRDGSAPYVLLLNSDAALVPGCLQQLVAKLDDDPCAAVAAPRLEYPDGSWQRWTAGRRPGPMSAFTYFTGLDRLSARWPALGGMYLGHDTAEPVRPEWVSGACALLRRSSLEEVGLFDESMFCYLEDVELCDRLRRAGWDVWYLPAARCRHHLGRSSGSEGAGSTRAVRELHRYVRRTQGPVSAAAVRAAALVGFGVRAAGYAARGRFLGGGPAVLAAARTHWARALLSLELHRA